MKSLVIFKSVLFSLILNSFAFAYLENRNKDVSFLGKKLSLKGNIIDGYDLFTPFYQSFHGADINAFLADYSDLRPRGFSTQTKFGPLLAEGSFRAIGHISIKGVHGKIRLNQIYSFKEFPQLLFVSPSKDPSNPRLEYNGKRVSHFIVDVHSSEIHELTAFKDLNADRPHDSKNLLKYMSVKKNKFSFAH